MEIHFQTKEESKKRQREEFLKLSPGERFMAFLELSRKVNQFPTSRKKDKINQYIISKPQ
ncbi:hypothetical protein [Pararhodonellum marinum]|uniref:hypothetical protein n=1 Tax=Pararhodonellum marinum TaxID=2755358 RepID=UPI00188F5CFD|nr:hypothetical protein [Pararhodonellum marinum]